MPDRLTIATHVIQGSTAVLAVALLLAVVTVISRKVNKPTPAPPCVASTSPKETMSGVLSNVQISNIDAEPGTFIKMPTDGSRSVFKDVHIFCVDQKTHESYRYPTGNKKLDDECMRFWKTLRTRDKE